MWMFLKALLNWDISFLSKSFNWKWIYREVKVEIRDDNERLHRSANGQFELFLLTSEGSSHSDGSSGLPLKAARHHLVGTLSGSVTASCVFISASCWDHYSLQHRTNARAVWILAFIWQSGRRWEWQMPRSVIPSYLKTFHAETRKYCLPLCLSLLSLTFRATNQPLYL